ncbi:tRNA (N(6)-L-threonylcarbamoyladenosine(37)-C(2))-methylthiotransferase MtaB [Dorea sp. D27]|uniref:tRNA (N(6)-L-threonylcarbamoyladenosine(37)-C(2))- methylthiotransferase MtaB n=1 Tax=Dorea sp. D27 TaxID=658665 RepID=UPI000673A011|nr:tRNA (N(6)-L-threonylcarbamoyladenosine(37)-C(2))-methylthiotransferase MtaB [Dorea sp. D27]KMZ55753.1 2-methylthioadenine synthetase [Dorea sp. D27]
MKKVALHNLGCKVNAYESEAMQELLAQHGYEIVPFEEGADIYIINTCTVTNMADRKSRQMLHRARKMNPDAVVVAAGCYVQAQGEGADDCIDIVIGNNRKKDLIQILKEYEDGRWEAGEGLVDINHTDEYEELNLSQTAEHTRAYIKVQDGCNQFCSYCIIPYARGRVRSRNRESVLAEVRRLADRGYKEVVLTGIHLSSYGVDTGDTLLGLIHAVHETAGLERIRLGSLEPGIITAEFAGALAGLPKFCPHFHLSLQSGCNATLKRMNRRYTAEEYDEKCKMLREYFQNPALTTDIIVGFPGETDVEFEESRAFIDKVDFYETHVFKYSKREGTKAAAMENQVPDEVKAARSGILLELSRRKQAAYEAKLLGTTAEVLVEETVMRDGELYAIGHTKEYVKIGRKGSENLTNKVINVEIESPLQIIH